VKLPSFSARSSGVPSATTRPPPSPPSGPRSMTQSAVFTTSRLCSIHDDRIAAVGQSLEHLEQARDIGKMEAGSRLVKDVERAPGGPLRQLRGKLDALCLAAR